MKIRILTELYLQKKSILDTSESQFYEKLKKQLEETSEWPSEYLFKFILPSDEPSIDKLKGIFDDEDAKIYTRFSSKGKYSSVNIRLVLDNPDQVIEKYKTVGYQIEGVISL